MAMEIYISKNFNVITIILIYCMASSFCTQQVAEPSKPNVLCTSGNDCLNRDNGNDGRILSRRKRALTFPEGSSLQLGMTFFQVLYM